MTKKETYISEVLDMFPKWGALREDFRVLLEKTWDAAQSEVGGEPVAVTADCKLSSSHLGLMSMDVIHSKLIEFLRDTAFKEHAIITEVQDPVTGEIMIHGELKVIKRKDGNSKNTP